MEQLGAQVTVYIVTSDNGRVHSVHSDRAGAERELNRATRAGEIYATYIEEWNVIDVMYPETP